jgi:hypothetical protein
VLFIEKEGTCHDPAVRTADSVGIITQQLLTCSRVCVITVVDGFGDMFNRQKKKNMPLVR